MCSREHPALGVCSVTLAACSSSILHHTRCLLPSIPHQMLSMPGCCCSGAKSVFGQCKPCSIAACFVSVLVSSQVSGLHYVGAIKVASDGSGWSQRRGKQQQGEAAGRGQQNKQRWTRAAGLQLSAAEAGMEAPGAHRLLGVACSMKEQREGSTSATSLRGGDSSSTARHQQEHQP